MSSNTAVFQPKFADILFVVFRNIPSFLNLLIESMLLLFSFIGLPIARIFDGDRESWRERSSVGFSQH
jgi:hypothetical protein